ncbi:hypothetical protein HPG69_004922 [Diceros bicornis minor]|uniref:Uncharacterized protein n=1 Tax=Diceros bicornis minor TaxID=77932 RepID=A0A7J7E564_DICBM|nr:hypothetical protein HPG69_004922 [Diceros bicornis minor]
MSIAIHEREEGPQLSFYFQNLSTCSEYSPFYGPGLKSAVKTLLLYYVKSFEKAFTDGGKKDEKKERKSLVYLWEALKSFSKLRSSTSIPKPLISFKEIFAILARKKQISYKQVDNRDILKCLSHEELAGIPDPRKAVCKRKCSTVKSRIEKKTEMVLATIISQMVVTRMVVPTCLNLTICLVIILLKIRSRLLLVIKALVLNLVSLCCAQKKFVIATSTEIYVRISIHLIDVYFKEKLHKPSHQEDEMFDIGKAKNQVTEQCKIHQKAIDSQYMSKIKAVLQLTAICVPCSLSQKEIGALIF